MKRRDFLKACAAAGVGVSVAGIHTSKDAWAQAAQTNGTFFINAQMRGGWSPTSICDPQHMVEPDFTEADIGTVAGSPILYAPYPGAQAFFEANAQNMCVINGIDVQTNSHETGRRSTSSGNGAMGYPVLAAAIAAKLSGQLPLAFIENGGESDTAGIVAAVRADNRSTQLIEKIAFSNQVNAGDNNNTFHSEFAMEQIRNATQLRLEQQQVAMNLPKTRDSMARLFASRAGETELEGVLQYLNVDTNGMEQIARQAMVGLGAFRAGLGRSMTVNMGGWDTHGDHFQRHGDRTQQMYAGLQQIIDQAQNLGIADKLVIMVTSDFGRTPNYNGGRGKDHWPITSMMVWSGSAANGIPLNTVIGQSDEGHGPVTMNPQTLQPDENGIRLNHMHVHASVRKLFGITNDGISRQFPLGVETLPLFGA